MFRRNDSFPLEFGNGNKTNEKRDLCRLQIYFWKKKKQGSENKNRTYNLIYTWNAGMVPGSDTKERVKKMSISIINHGEPEKRYVVEGAVLKCNFGTLVSRLKLPISHGVYIKGKRQANIGDHSEVTNISCFGICQSPMSKGVCTPFIPMKWVKGKEDVIVEEEAALMNDSFCTCLLGGVITIEEDGQ